MVENDSGASFSYRSLLHAIARAKELLLLLKMGRSDATISGERIAFIIEPGFDYVGKEYQVPFPFSWKTRRVLNMAYSDLPGHPRRQRNRGASGAFFPRARTQINSES